MANPRRRKRLSPLFAVIAVATMAGCVATPATQTRTQRQPDAPPAPVTAGAAEPAEEEKSSSFAAEPHGPLNEDVAPADFETGDTSEDEDQRRQDGMYSEPEKE
ncbi:MAG TPA: hypothetical protein VM369_07990 [Candidatus Binatia bacterium]|nr:hypothetical protein [Candidatus Binatia bacterium]